MQFQLDTFTFPIGTNPSFYSSVQRQHSNVRRFFKSFFADFEQINAFWGSFKQ